MAACPSSVRIVFRTNSATCALTANRLDAFGWYRLRMPGGYYVHNILRFPPVIRSNM